MTFALFGAIWLCGAPAAFAQRWLAPAYPVLATFGPVEANGAVIWSHGRSLDGEDFDVPTPPYVAALRDGGWDAFRFNRRRAGDTLGESAQALVEEAHRLKRQGYRRLTLAGQSFGAFLSLMAAGASDDIDAVIATAPAAYGAAGERGGHWLDNATALYPLLEQVRRARVMVFYFRGDAFDPGGRGTRSRAILLHAGTPALVIDQPADLASHWAAATSRFARLYGGCILGFLDAAQLLAGARCDGDRLLAGTAAIPLAPGGASASANGG